MKTDQIGCEPLNLEDEFYLYGYHTSSLKQVCGACTFKNKKQRLPPILMKVFELGLIPVKKLIKVINQTKQNPTQPNPTTNSQRLIAVEDNQKVNKLRTFKRRMWLDERVAWVFRTSFKKKKAQPSFESYAGLCQ